MRQEPDISITTPRQRHPDDATYDLFHEIETYCRTHHFTIFYGAVQEEGLPQAAWNFEQNPRWEDFLDVAEALEVRVVYLDPRPLPLITSLRSSRDFAAAPIAPSLKRMIGALD